ncbi:SNF5-domain-containing protein [Artomyces pyxidatus]|uniref:SNF5-domain-containing protein n=1 Tax=Artomyces pyxidatus TaxID=48021 RepID=A0ACB8T841_9AGAM|nr:SNF5-domain-containing protein [Artomyces pyxidatus]
MASGSGAGSSFTIKYSNMSDMTDSQLRQTISQLSHAASGAQYQGFAAPTPQRTATYQKNLQNWSTTSTPPSRAGSRRSRPARGSNLAPATPTPIAPAPAPAPVQHASALAYQPPPPLPSAHATQTTSDKRQNPPRAPLTTTSQALQSTYASRLRTGATLLMQPILSGSVAAAVSTTAARPRRGGIVSYADPGSGDDIPDAGEVDSDGSDFVASGGTRTAVRAARNNSRMGGMAVFTSGAGGAPGTPTPQQRDRERDRVGDTGKTELDQSYLGLVPPSRFIVSKPVALTKHVDYPQDSLEDQAQRPTSLVPIRVEFETDTHRIRDCFVWNLHEKLVTPEQFARTFIADLDLPEIPWVETVTNQIRAQLEDQEGVGAMELAVDATEERNDEIPECRVVLSIDVQVDNHHLLDHIEWDLRSSLTPEAFTQQLCLDLGLSGEAAPLIAHAVHEELMKHKKDAIEWGVIGGVADAPATETVPSAPRDKSGLGLLKDKTGLGLGWGRAPKQGRGPRVLRSVWRDWAEAEEFKTRWEVLSQEEVEKREIERERASRRLRRETSKFQSSARTRRR